ncbi:MAG TPA: cysteine--tRNA ligase [Nitrospirales bacterium]
MSALKIFNTMSRRKEPFEPMTAGRVGMYVCGVTVYDECHLGHARSAIVFDVIRRYLEHRNLEVTFVKNFTDIDDKIIKRAQEQSLPWQALTSRFIDAYYRDMVKLGVRPATLEPKATEHVNEIIKLIQVLVAKGIAYQVDTDVYFHVKAFPRYGMLSKRKLDELQAGARVEIDERKRDPMDFALWKGAKPAEPAWDSPWGSGRPGWHIECSAMSIRHLGETLDIHGGGEDLVFPHHENEIAQSEAATGKEFARYWVHNGMVTVDREKMSKSLGNFFTIREIFEKFPASAQVTAEILRFFLLSTHYRSPVDFSDAALRQAHAGLNNFYDLFKRLEERARDGSFKDAAVHGAPVSGTIGFEQAMDDDFNTPLALASLQRVRSDVNTRLQAGLSAHAAKDALSVFRTYGLILGLFQVPPSEWEFGQGEATASVMADAEIERLIEERHQARAKKDWARADALRQELAERGIMIEDRPDGSTRWKR